MDAFHDFYREDKHDSSIERLAAYQELGLDEEAAWSSADDSLRFLRKIDDIRPGDINKHLSGVALGRHLKDVFDKSSTKMNAPQFGYMGTDYHLEQVLDAHLKLGIKGANYFTLNNSEPHEEIVKKIFLTCGRELNCG